jgi:hypothetical protein
MDSKHYLPPLVCGFGAAVLTTIPGVKSLGCCLIVPLAAILSLFLDHKINKTELPFRFKNAMFLGLLTGIFATFFSTFFDVLMTYILHTNEFVQTLPQTEELVRQYKLGVLLNQTMGMLKQMSKDIQQNGFSLFYIAGIFFSNFIINSIFGTLGGLLGLSFINKKVKK